MTSFPDDTSAFTQGKNCVSPRSTPDNPDSELSPGINDKDKRASEGYETGGGACVFLSIFEPESLAIFAGNT